MQGLVNSTPANKRRCQLVWAACLLLLLCLFIALAFGTVSLPLLDVFGALFGNDESNRTNLIIDQIRLPRALLAALIGGLLGICGAATQGLFRNPLADPSLIGVTAGASASAALMIFLSANFIELEGWLGISLVSLSAFIGGCFTVILVYRLATNSSLGGTSGGSTSVATMLLAGIAITAIAGGLTSLVEFFSDNEMLRRISLWRMGGLDGANYQRVSVALFVSCILFSVLPRYSTTLNALLLGESEARHLGIAVQKSKVAIITLVAAGVATSVALAGTIAFVGLVVPHIIRLMIGPDHRFLLPLSAIGGAILLLLADTLARTLFAPIELPVGLVTAFIGAPFFISLLRIRHSYSMQ